MTPEEARIVLLEQALDQACNTIGFMHGCLTDDKHYGYAYPEHTAKHLEAFRLLAPERESCVHSMTMQHVDDCPGCQAHVKWATERAEAYELLKIKPPWETT